MVESMKNRKVTGTTGHLLAGNRESAQRHGRHYRLGFRLCSRFGLLPAAGGQHQQRHRDPDWPTPHRSPPEVPISRHASTP